MTPDPKITVSPDGRMMHISEAAYLDPERSAKELLLEEGKRLLGEIMAVDLKNDKTCIAIDAKSGKSGSQ